MATAMHVNVRGHGPTGRYNGSYVTQTLARWGNVSGWRDGAGLSACFSTMIGHAEHGEVEPVAAAAAGIHVIKATARARVRLTSTAAIVP